MDKVIKNYTIHQKIGQGATGAVFYVTDENNNKYALKLQHNLPESEKAMNNQIKEIKFQNVANTYEQFEYKKDFFNYFCIVMDFCNIGDLYQYLIKYRQELKNEYKKQMLFQIAFGIWEIHQINIIHRDIKPSNILVQCYDGCDFQLKICDLGLSKKENLQNLNTLNIGTPYYMAPELIDPSKNKAIYDKSVDIWAFGAIIYDFFCNQQLFHGLQIYQIFAQIKQGKDLSQKLSAVINDPLLLEIAVWCLSYDPSKRPQIQEILMKLKETEFLEKKKIFQEKNTNLFQEKVQEQVQNLNEQQKQSQLCQNQFQPQTQDQVSNQQQNQQYKQNQLSQNQFQSQTQDQVSNQQQNQQYKQNQLCQNQFQPQTQDQVSNQYQNQQYKQNQLCQNQFQPQTQDQVSNQQQNQQYKQNQLSQNQFQSQTQDQVSNQYQNQQYKQNQLSQNQFQSQTQDQVSNQQQNQQYKQNQLSQNQFQSQTQDQVSNQYQNQQYKQNQLSQNQFQPQTQDQVSNQYQNQQYKQNQLSQNQFQPQTQDQVSNQYQNLTQKQNQYSQNQLQTQTYDNNLQKNQEKPSQKSSNYIKNQVKLRISLSDPKLIEQLLNMIEQGYQKSIVAQEMNQQLIKKFQDEFSKLQNK